MNYVNGFFDYCISDQCLRSNGNFDNIAKRLLELGYHTIAINQTIEESGGEPKKKKKKGESREIVELVPVPIEVKLKEEYQELKVLNRLTITFGNQEYIHKITKSPNYKKYHLIAACPTTQSAFQFVCSNMEADILTFNAENKLLYKLSRKLYNQLISKRYHFEILYAGAILDSTKRKNTIYMSHLYHTYGKSKNVIISSGANSEDLIRSPYDVINLGLIFGLNREQSKQAITYNCKNVYISSVGRRHGKAVMFMENVKKKEVLLMEDEVMQTKEGEDVNERLNDKDDCDDEEMDVDQPVHKKSRQ